MTVILSLGMQISRASYRSRVANGQLRAGLERSLRSTYNSPESAVTDLPYRSFDSNTTIWGCDKLSLGDPTPVRGFGLVPSVPTDILRNVDLSNHAFKCNESLIGSDYIAVALCRSIALHGQDVYPLLTVGSQKRGPSRCRGAECPCS